MKESIYLSTPEHAKLEFELAGLASRFMAHAIDLLVIGCILTCLSLLLFLGPFASLVRDRGAFDSYGIAVIILISFSILWGYYFLLEGYFQGITPGKKMMGIRVLREDGMPIGFYESAIRNLVRAADAFPPPTYLLGGVSMHLDDAGKRLGDMVAGTIVVCESFPKIMETKTGAAWAARVEKGHSRRPLSLAGGNVTVKQLDLIEQYLNRCTTFPLERRRDLTEKMAAPLWKLSGNIPPQADSMASTLERDETFLDSLLQLANEEKTLSSDAFPMTDHTTFF